LWSGFITVAFVLRRPRRPTVDTLATMSGSQRFCAVLAIPDATLLMLEFQATSMRSVVGGVTRADVEAAFPGWEMLSVEPADTTGLGWPLNKTTPQWCRLRRQA
jgi:hypothetical protein